MDNMRNRNRQIMPCIDKYNTAAGVLEKIKTEKKPSNQERMEIDEAFRIAIDALIRSNNGSGAAEIAGLEKAHIELLETLSGLREFLALSNKAGSMVLTNKINIADGRFQGISRDEAKGFVRSLRDAVYIVKGMPLPVELDEVK